jgi:hypothetical protein
VETMSCIARTKKSLTFNKNKSKARFGTAIVQRGNEENYGITITINEEKIKLSNSDVSTLKEFIRENF